MIEIPSIRTLKRIRTMASKLCGDAKAAGVDGAINWGDLGCVNVEIFINCDAGQGVRVYIEEANPHNTELREFIEDGLESVYGNLGGIEVVTEW